MSDPYVLKNGVFILKGGKAGSGVPLESHVIPHGNTSVGAELDKLSQNLTSKIEYDSVTITSSTKYSDVEDLIVASLQSGKQPHLVADVTYTGTTQRNLYLTFVRDAYIQSGTTHNGMLFANYLDGSGALIITIRESYTQAGANQTFSNCTLYY